ncbi:putative RNA-directed DNA polymerase [Helianthus annuus]|nr:putative RNA-directed DNA polymerase [Helianthus annuus]
MAGNKEAENSTNNDGAVDASSPLYVHPSDYPKQIHVNDNLTDNNYVDWSQEMLNFLFAKNKVGLVDGTIKKPDKASPTYMAWMRADAMVKGWLTTAMEKDIRNSVKYAHISSNDEPRNFNQAVQDEKWKEAMVKEIWNLEGNGTWTLENLPEGKRSIDSKWVYKIKYKPNGEVERYKARLVAKGFTQMEGVDYHDTFAPVAKIVTVRTLLVVAVKRNWTIHQLDVNNAFLHGDRHEEVYMKIPQGFSKEGETKVCRLRKSLYGLKQASRNWYHKFTTFLLGLGFKQSKADHSLFIYKQKDVFVAALIYVDDVIIVGNDPSKIHDTKENLHKQFSIKDLGSLKYFLGVEVARTSEGQVLSQRKYTLDILEDCGLQGCRLSSFPIEQNLKLDKDSQAPKVDASQYRRIVGRLLYLQATRPDIAYSVNVLSQFVVDPRQNHLDAVHRVLRYLKGTPR